MRIQLSRTTKEALKSNLRTYSIAAVAEGLGAYLFLFYAIPLIDVRLAVTLIVVELPTAVFLSYLFGERRRATVQGAAEHFRAAKEFSHLVVHRFPKFGFFPYVFRVWFYSVENTRTNHSYEAPEYVMILSDKAIIRLVDHESEKKQLDYFKSKSILVEEREATASELA
jgi:hypothetical protein